MIHVRSFRTAGKCHGFDISRCQDQIRILSDATQTTIVLCDGAGSSPYGGIAASVTASILARNLHSNFEQYLHNALPDIKMQLTRTINNELKKMAKEMQIAPRLLATTILAISMDKNGKFIGVHLGDGCILWNIPLTSGIFSVQNQDLLNQKMINTRNFDDMSYVLCELDAPCSRQ